MNTFGRLFCVTTFGESHGPSVGAVVDGCPARLPLDASDLQKELDRRRPGRNAYVSQRQESDRCRIVSGVFEGRTLGSPIAIVVDNEDTCLDDYRPLAEVLRPSHADYTYLTKYGLRAWHGGGRASARETVGRVAAGAVARKLLRRLGVEIVGWVDQVGMIAAQVDPTLLDAVRVEESPIRCPDPRAADAMKYEIERVRGAGDSVGGVVGLVARGVPAGLGEPVFDKLTSELARALMSIPATRGFEVGSGFGAARLTGSEHNDRFVAQPLDPGVPDGPSRIRTLTNRSGGIQGGISNGEAIVLRVAFKPTATIAKDQETVTIDGRPAVVSGKGRHDPCVVPRAVVVCEAMVALVLIDHYLRQRALDPARVPDLGL